MTRSDLAVTLAASLAVCLCLLVPRVGLAQTINVGFNPGLKNWNIASDPSLSADVVDEPSASSGKAMRVNVSEQPAKPWQVQVRHPLPSIGPIETGQPVGLSARVHGPAGADIAVALQLAERPFTGVVFQRVTLDGGWQTIEIDRKAQGFADAGKTQLTFTLGFNPGEYKLSDITVDVGELPTVDATPTDELAPVHLDRLGVPGLAGVLGEDPRSIVPAVGDMNLWSKQAERTTTPDGVVMQTLEKTEFPYNVQAYGRLLRPVAPNDTLVTLLRWRAVEPNELIGYASLGVAFETAGPPHDKSIDRLTTAAPQPGDAGWRTDVVAFRPTRDYRPEQAQAVLRLGYGRQAVEVSDFAVVNLGQTIAPQDVPGQSATYGGAEPDAPWRDAAAQRIREHRMAPLTVRVVDEQGNPVENATVSIEQTRPEFGFGSAISVFLLPGGRRADEGQRYLDTAAELFNWGVFENGMKWKMQTTPWAPPIVERGLAWMHEQGWTIRGHALIWPSFRRSPDFVAELADHPAELRRTIDTHIREKAEKYAGHIYAWDVVNEPYKHRDFLDILGDEELVRWFNIAASADPDALLFLNDFFLLSDPSAEPVKFNWYLDLIERLRAAGARIDGLGLQAHFSGQMTAIPTIIERLDRLHAMNLRVHVTELDISTTNDELQAAYLRDFLTACYSHPAVEGVVMWGFWEGHMFAKNAGLYRKNWSIKPAGQAYRDLVLDQWTTRDQLTTDANGDATIDAHRGDYTLTVTLEGKTIKRDAKIDEDGAELTITR